MKKKLVMMALVLTVAFGGCGNAATQEAQEAAVQEEQETVAQEAEAGADAAASEEAEATDENKETAADEKTTTDKKTVADKEAETAKEAEEVKKETADKEAAKLDETEASKETNEKDTDTKETTDKASKDKDSEDKDANDKDTKSEDAETETPKLPEYTVTAFEEVKVMFASNAVNVRKGPTTDFDRVGGLNRGQEVSVTGQADTGWYEIAYGEEKAFVSDHYLQNEKPADPAPVADAAGQPQAVTEVKNVAGVILVGDSRFVQMQENVGPNSCTWIAENAKGYNWLNETAMARIDGCVGKGSKILINLGVNDPGNVNKYLELINAKSAEWVNKGAKVYYASVNPVWENPHTTEEQVHYFNSQMQNGLSGNVHWIDSHTYLESIGFKLVDGLHYNAETYQNIFAYYMSCL